MLKKSFPGGLPRVLGEQNVQLNNSIESLKASIYYIERGIYFVEGLLLGKL